MIWLSIVVILNSVAIIATVKTARANREYLEALNERVNRSKLRCDKAMEAIGALEEENRIIRREVIKKTPHQPLNDSKFIYGGWSRSRFEGGQEINDKFMDYVANIALKVIVSELPEEIQTHEIINEIIRRVKNEFAKSKIKS